MEKDLGRLLYRAATNEYPDLTPTKLEKISRKLTEKHLNDTVFTVGVLMEEFKAEIRAEASIHHVKRK